MQNDVDNAIQVLRSELSPELYKKLSDQNVFELLKLAGEGRLQAQRLAALKSVAPVLGTVLSDFSKSYTSIAEQAGKSHTAAFTESTRKLQATLASLESVAKACENDASRIEIASMIDAAHARACAADVEMAKSNNGFFSSAFKYISGAVFVVVAIGLALTGQRNNGSV